jgi:hypothetical protein
MMKRAAAITLALAFVGPAHAADDEHYSHPAPEKLGSVHFPTSCTPTVQREFDRAVALLHSFAYAAAEHLGDTRTVTRVRAQLTQ